MVKDISNLHWSGAVTFLLSAVLGMDHYKSYGGGGGEIFEPQEFFSLSNFLNEFFLGYGMNIF